MERKPTRPAPVSSGKKKSSKKKPDDELTLALASIRQSVETMNLDDKEKSEHEEIEVVQEKEEQEEMEKVQLEAVDRLEPSTYHLFGVPISLPKQNHEQEIPTGPYDELVQKVDRFNQLMSCWKSSSAYNPEKKVDLAWLETNVGPHFDWMEKRQEPTLLEKGCPFHRSEELKVLNPEAEFGPLYYKCPVENCPVWCTSETLGIVLKELLQNTHHEVRSKITSLRCKCGCVPRMKLSRTEKNFRRVFLTCGQEPYQVKPCGYFQWMHGPLWKPKRASHPTLEQFQTKVSRWQTRSTSQGEYFQDTPSALDRHRITHPGCFQQGSGFRPPPSAFLENRPFGTPAETRTFEQLCDERNADRVKHNCAPYSYDTYRRYGLGIF